MSTGVAFIATGLTLALLGPVVGGIAACVCGLFLWR